MIRLTKHRTTRVSNRLALYAALLLIVASIVSVGNTVDTGSMEQVTAQAGDPQNSQTSGSAASGRSSSGFSKSLFLIR